VVGAVFGAGCDGELDPAEVAERLAEVDAAGGGLGELELTPAVVDRLIGAVEHVPTEASAMALRCARGAGGTATIRQGRRTVQLTPAGGRIAFFEPLTAIASAARLAAAVAEADDLAEADAILNARGVRTELRYEREAARERASPG